MWPADVKWQTPPRSSLGAACYTCMPGFSPHKPSSLLGTRPSEQAATQMLVPSPRVNAVFESGQAAQGCVCVWVGVPVPQTLGRPLILHQP